MIPNLPVANFPKIELRIKCRNLKDKDVLSKSDPQVFLIEERLGEWHLVGSTEKVKNNLNPDFAQPIKIDYHFERVQYLNFVVIDIDKEVKSLKDLDSNDYIGNFYINLSNILASPGRNISKELTLHNKFSGTIQVQAEEVVASQHLFNFSIEGTHLDKKDLFSSDPYFNVYKKTSPTDYSKVYQSKVIKNTLNPDYSDVTIRLDDLTGGNLQREIKFEFMDWDAVGDHDLIGEFTTTVDAIMQGQNIHTLVNPKKAGKSSYKGSGSIHFNKCRFVSEPTFLDYIAGGCDFNLTIGIDCTASNGSLHDVDEKNQYLQSIRAVGNVLSDYDSDGYIDVYGFGGDINGETSHCFAFSQDEKKPSVKGVKGVVELYSTMIKKVTLSAPTYFAPLLEHSIEEAKKDHKSGRIKYNILLILTDGEICDMDPTIKAIIKASKLPMSIVIVGVGNALFSNMEKLDGDNGGLQRDGHKAERDIVQFVEFSKFKDNYMLLAQEVLSEIPQQFMAWAKKNNIKPNRPNF
ncbi:hypothetical protein CYY_004771 [Polysphondylium violaceum]|uniref:Phospholipid-binding protein n=1 Tax=Polysphondylium violaceum TaxID=133409 RepID=A0A8J4PVY5_9MYCE|nr:hypothetical protein CYY_004771 [Polysphondylium violaceum]